MPFQRIIHYNGAGFDLPYLQKKYEFYRREVPFCEMDTLDLYRKFRPFQKLFGLPSMKQKSLEAFAGFSREDTFSGGDLIYAYEEYLASANPALLKTLYLHNKEDVLGMVQILSLYGLADLFSGNFTISGITLSPPSLILSLSLEVPVFLPFTRKSGVFSVTADQKLARLEIQGQQRELKFFFPNYKDYYYLPLEDTAIHKSVGAYVDAEHREKPKHPTAISAIRVCSSHSRPKSFRRFFGKNIKQRNVSLSGRILYRKKRSSFSVRSSCTVTPGSPVK